MYIPISESQIGNTDDGTKKKKKGNPSVLMHL